MSKTHIEILTEALATILRGSEIDGRWIDQLDYNAVEGGDSEKQVPAGYYDESEPPEEDDDDTEVEYPDDVEEGEREQLLLVGGEWLKPAVWEPYNKEDQDSWIGSVQGICEAALAATKTPPEPPKFDPSTLTEAELSQCLDEMRKRGSAVAIYDVDEILTMTDGWDNQPTEEALKPWWEANRTDIEDAMCEGGRELILDFVDGKGDDDLAEAA